MNDYYEDESGLHFKLGSALGDKWAACQWEVRRLSEGLHFKGIASWSSMVKDVSVSKAIRIFEGYPKVMQ